MVSQGFFSGSEKRSKRLAGQKENKVALGGDNLGSFGGVGAVIGVGALGIKGIKSAIEGGKRLKENIERRVNPERETSFFSPRGNEVSKIASSDISSLRVGSPEVRIANVKSYTEGGIKPYAPDRVGDYIRDSERPSYTPEKDTGYGASLEKSMSDLSDTSKGIFGIDEKTKEYGVPMSKEEKRATTAYEMTNLSFPFKDRYKFSDTNYANIQADYDKYKNLRDRRDTRREAEEAVNKFRSDAMADFKRADYAIRMKQYNLDGTEKDINKYNQTLDQQLNDLKRVRDANETYSSISKIDPNFFDKKEFYALDRFGKVRPQSEVAAYEKQVAAEEAERNRLSKLKAKTDYEESQKNIYQKVGEAVGNVFNTLTGTLPAKGDTLQAQGINTGSTVNLSQIGNVSPTVQSARDAVARANLRKSGLDRTIGGQSSQANYGRASRGFGTGTHGKGMPSNPAGMRQKGVGVSAGNLSRHKAGPSTSKGGVSRSTSRGQGGGTSSRSRGGTGTGSSRSNTGSKSSARGARGSAGSRSRGGTGSGGTSTSRSASKASRSRTGRSRTRCDIRTKIDISPLINSNLVKDNLAELAYFVQEIKK